MPLPSRLEMSMLGRVEMPLIGQVKIDWWSSQYITAWLNQDRVLVNLRCTSIRVEITVFGGLEIPLLG